MIATSFSMREVRDRLVRKYGAYGRHLWNELLQRFNLGPTDEATEEFVLAAKKM